MGSPCCLGENSFSGAGCPALAGLGSSCRGLAGGSCRNEQRKASACVPQQTRAQQAVSLTSLNVGSLLCRRSRQTEVFTRGHPPSEAPMSLSTSPPITCTKPLAHSGLSVLVTEFPSRFLTQQSLGVRPHESADSAPGARRGMGEGLSWLPVRVASGPGHTHPEMSVLTPTRAQCSGLPGPLWLWRRGGRARARRLVHGKPLGRSRRWSSVMGMLGRCVSKRRPEAPHSSLASWEVAGAAPSPWGLGQPWPLGHGADCIPARSDLCLRESQPHTPVCP